MTKRTVALISLLAIVVAACGRGAVADEVATLETTAVEVDPVGESDLEDAAGLDAEEALLAFTQCLREEGLDVDDPTIDADGIIGFGLEFRDQDFEAFEAAQEVCAVHLEGVTRGFNAVDETEFEDQLLEFAACMRENGVDMDDPDFSKLGPGGGGEGGPFGAVNPDDPAFQQASEACSELLGSFGPGQR